MPKRVHDKHREHTPYFNAAGKRVPGVTTIIGREIGWKTDRLKNWANRMGLQGIDTTKYTDDKAKIGTLAHAYCTDFLLRKKTNEDDYSKSQIVEARRSFQGFLKWVRLHKVRPLLIEGKLVSEDFQYGGTCDIYAEVDGFRELDDLKTGSGVFIDMIVQVAAYAHSLEENGYPVDRVRIINIPRSEDESFIDPEVTSMIPLGWKIFQRARYNYADHNELEKKWRG